MGAQLLHPAAVEDGNLVRVADGGEPVSDREGRPLLLRLQLVQGLLHLQRTGKWARVSTTIQTLQREEKDKSYHRTPKRALWEPRPATRGPNTAHRHPPRLRARTSISCQRASFVVYTVFHIRIPKN